MKTFVLAAAERAVRAFAAALVGAFTANATVATIDWPAALAIAGTAALVSVLTSLLSIPITGSTSTSLLPPVAHGRHEAP